MTHSGNYRAAIASRQGRECGQLLGGPERGGGKTWGKTEELWSPTAWLPLSSPVAAAPDVLVSLVGGK